MLRPPREHCINMRLNFYKMSFDFKVATAIINVLPGRDRSVFGSQTRAASKGAVFVLIDARAVSAIVRV